MIGVARAELCRGEDFGVQSSITGVPFFKSQVNFFARCSDFFGRMSLPILYFSDYLQAFPCAKGVRRISGKLFVGEVWIILNRTQRFNDVYPSGPVANGQFCSPNGDI